MKKPGLTAWIIFAMLAGIITGLLVHYNTGEVLKGQFSKGMSILTDIFQRRDNHFDQPEENIREYGHAF